MDKLPAYQLVKGIDIESDEFVKTSTKKTKHFLYKGRLDVVYNSYIYFLMSTVVFKFGEFTRQSTGTAPTSTGAPPRSRYE